MCPLIENSATLLKSLIGHSNLKRSDDELSIWSAVVDQGGWQKLFERIRGVVRLVLDEYPYAFVSSDDLPDSSKRINPFTNILSPKITPDDFFKTCAEGISTIYVASEPIPEAFGSIGNPEKIPDLIRNFDIALILIINCNEGRLDIGLNPSSKFLESRNLWKKGYLSEIYPEFAHLMGGWLDGLYRPAFKNDSEVAFFLSYGTTGDFRKKFISQIERLIQELPFPRTQVEIITNRTFKDNRKAIDWLKDVRHEFQLRSSYEEVAERTVRMAERMLKQYTPACESHGLRFSKTPEITVSSLKPSSMTLSIDLFRNAGAVPFKSLEFDLMEHGESRISEVEEELEKMICNIVEKNQKPVSRKLVNIVWLIAAAILVVLAIYWLSGMFGGK